MHPAASHPAALIPHIFWWLKNSTWVYRGLSLAILSPGLLVILTQNQMNVALTSQRTTLETITRRISSYMKNITIMTLSTK
jgi:hypothetical protein